jgi:hypothetical protein
MARPGTCAASIPPLTRTILAQGRPSETSGPAPRGVRGRHRRRGRPASQARQSGLDGLRCVTRVSSPAEAVPTELQRSPRVRGSTNVHLGFDDQSANGSSSQVGPLARTTLNLAHVELTGNSSFFLARKSVKRANILTSRRRIGWF